ncbi:MAG: hypothetical protein JWR84_1475 [Caulobacter sp.]|nr:hypothetical protein [Caulobacter sp.]
MPSHDPNSPDLRFGDLHVVRALFGGAAAGAGLVTVGFAVMASLNGGMVGRLASEPRPAPLEGLWTTLPFLMLVFPIAYIGWLIGLVLLGAPGWFLLHRLRLRGLKVAIPFGFILAGSVGASFVGGMPIPSLLFAIAGGIVATAVWFLGYRTR